MVTTTIANAVTSSTRAALLILEHAERTGLPMPWSVHTNDADQPVRLMFDSLPDLTEWALWLGQPIGEHTTDTHVHHGVQGDALDHPVRCHYLAPLPATAAGQ